MSFRDGPQPEEADRVLGSAHMLLLFLLQRFNELFSVGLTNVDALTADFSRCWNLPLDT